MHLTQWVTGVMQLLPRVRWRVLGARVVIAVGALAASLWAAAPSAGEGCPGVQAGDIAFALHADPPEVSVGEVVDVQVRITALGEGHAAIPLFRLLGAEPGFTVEALESSYPDVAYAHYRLRAMQPGDVTLRVAVNFATTIGCGDGSSLVFRSARSDLLPIRVRDVADARRGTVTPTGTALPEVTPRPVRRRQARH